ncbi:MAG: ester cyclase [Maribacter sp.]|nr:ester cyclase [Maribacter sp.]
MNISSKNRLLSMLLVTLLLFSCQSNPDKAKTSERNESSAIDSKSSEEENEIKAVLERILIAVGNRDVQELSALTFDQAIIGWSYLKDGIWLNKELTIEEYLSNISAIEHPKPISETAIEYNISITKGRIATVELPTIISQFGVARSEEVNHFTMMKENDQWKLLSVAWTVHRIPEVEREFDLNLFAQGYAQVWGSQRPEFVAMFFEEEGALQVNDGEPAIGRNAISKVAQSFMTKFPDINVRFDSLAHKPNGIEFHWTLTGTDADPGGNNHKVKVSGFELWTMSEGNLIKDSKGTFSSEEYNRQLEFGIDN